MKDHNYDVYENYQLSVEENSKLKAVLKVAESALNHYAQRDASLERSNYPGVAEVALATIKKIREE